MPRTKRSSVLITLFLVVGLAGSCGLAAGCAKGSDDSPVPGDEPAHAASRVETSAPLVPSVADAGAPDRKVPADAGKDTQTDQDAGGIACDTPKPCGDGRDIGEVKGDRGADTREAIGTTSEWLRVLVKQPSTSPWGDTAVTVTLESPPGANFDLYTYMGPINKGPAKCSGAADATSSSPSATDSAHLHWPETLSDDTRWLTIEVRHVSGTCTASATWKLTVAGNR